MGGLDEKPRSARLRSRLLSSVRESRPLLNLLLLASFFLCGLVYLIEPGAAPATSHRAPRRSLAPYTGPTPHVVEESSGPPHASGVNVTFLSWKPRVILARNFLSPAECEHMIAVAARSMQRSSVVSNNDGSSVLDSIRTSSGTFITHGEDGVIDGVLRRVAEFSMLPSEHQEALQILHYGLAEKYGAHMDTFHLPNMITREHGLQRVATALMFLNTPIRGGETVFPNLEPAGSQEGLSDCAKEGLAHKPQAGDLILFWSLSPSGEVEMGATHGACPVIEGEKWSAVRGAAATALLTHICLTPPAAALDAPGAVPARAREAHGGAQGVPRRARDVPLLGQGGRVRRQSAVHGWHGGRAGRLPPLLQRLPVSGRAALSASRFAVLAAARRLHPLDGWMEAIMEPHRCDPRRHDRAHADRCTFSPLLDHTCCKNIARAHIAQ